MTDPRKLRPSELCRLLNSTPLGEVIDARRLQSHRTRAGLRIGDGRTVDLIRYVAWLVSSRHTPERVTGKSAPPVVDLNQAAAGGAKLSGRKTQLEGHGQKLTGKQEAVIAALLTEPTYATAAAKAGICETTLYRWMHIPSFRAAYRRARRELIEAAIGRIQAATGQAVETLLSVARQGKRESDRVRAATALLDHACRGLEQADVLHGPDEAQDTSAMEPAEVVKILATRLRQLEMAEIPVAEKSRLTATLAEGVLKAISTEVISNRLEALQLVLEDRRKK